VLAGYFVKAAASNQGFWKTPIWKPNQRFFNLKELQATAHSFYKDLGIFFHCYLLSTVRENLHESSMVEGNSYNSKFRILSLD
jgi:hypothetical protein